mgnify:CR=1 FL=1
MRIPKSIFKAYDIRGIYKEELTEKTSKFVAEALSRIYKENNDTIIIGRDGRLSSKSLTKSLIEGFLESGKNVVDKAYFKKRHNWTNDFVIENHKGWVKYTTGSYQVYRAARDNRETINGGDHKFNGPFVTAYNEGIRITVQEALMISNQKWFK